MNKLVCTVALVATAFTSAGRAQERPKFAGTWVLVPDKSVPAGAAHQADVTITQDEQSLSFTRKAVQFSSSAGQVPSPATAAREEVTYALSYIFDSADHPSPTPPLPANVNPSMVMRSTTQSTYRAIWTQNQLVIITQEVRQPDRNGFAARRTNRLTFSLDADGLMTMESISVSDPTPGGPAQPTPTPSRSVYKKAS